MRSIKTSQLTNHLYVGFALLLLVLGIYGDALNPLLLYQYELVASGQWWRLVSCSFIHLGLYHMTINQLGLLLWHVLFGWRLRPSLWFFLIISTSAFGGVMLHFTSPPIEFYAGFSAVLHGLLAFSALHDYRRSKINRYIFLGLWAKVIYEQTPFYDVNYLEAHMNAPVIVIAHLYGATYGTVVALAAFIIQHRTRKFSEHFF